MWEYVWGPIAATPWASWRDFWLQQVFSDRFRVCFFLPLAPVLLLFSRRYLRHGIILTGLAFVAYVFGALYALFWLGSCVLFHRLSEQFAIEAKRKDVLQWGPPLAATGCIVGWLLISQAFEHLDLWTNWNDWLYFHAPWLYPVGARDFPWEPYWAGVTRPTPNGDPPPQLFRVLFHDPHIIGTAYFAIRMLHYFSEIKRDTIPRERRTLLNFMAYLCYAPTLMQGPIERFPQFQDEMDTCHERRSWPNVLPALGRMAWGMSKCLAGLLYLAPEVSIRLDVGSPEGYYGHPERIESYAWLYFGIYLQIYLLYLLFSGYCDITAGIARLLGYRQVENFKRPWLATSMRDFWRRWHISLSMILRDYIYIAFGGNRRHVTLNLCLTFIICGVWHRLTPHVALWGILMGLMVAVNQWWVQWMKRVEATPTGWLPAARRGVCRLWPLPQILSWALTMHCFVMSLLVFFGGWGAVRVAWELTRRPLAWLAGCFG